MIRKIKNKGWGVFADRNYKKGEVVERCYTILIPIKQERLIKKTILNDYYYDYDKKFIVIALGNGALYNHSYTPNMKALRKNKFIILQAIRNIRKGEELTHNYYWTKESNPSATFLIDK